MKDWKKMMPTYKHQFTKIQDLVGEVDANSEWQNPHLSANEFYGSQSYKDFTRNDVLFLYGRRGTGKTAFIRMMNYDIWSGKFKKVIASKILDKTKSYRCLTGSVRGSPLADYPTNELIPLLAEKWKWVITVSAMSALYERLKKETGPNSQEIKILHDYLKDQGMLKVEQSFWDPIDKLVNVLADNLLEIDNAATKVGLAIAKSFRQLMTPEYDKAITALKTILKSIKSYVVVLIDSMEVYNLRDKIGSCTISALIIASLDFYNNRDKDRILSKIAFQSEIYNQISQLNPGKSGVRELIILWRYKDLVCLLAKRFHARISGTSKVSLESLDNYSNALNFLHEYLPLNVTSEQGVKFDTLAYIIRHTQKKPRHIILITNIILTLADLLEIKQLPLPPDFINASVHTNLDLIFSEAFSVYNHVYSEGKQGAERLIKRVLSGMQSHFSMSDLDRSIGETSSLREEFSISRESVKQLLLESGAIGQVEKVSDDGPGGKRFVEAIFEYQIKGSLDANDRSSYVIHPMLYQNFKIVVDFNEYVYPMAYDSEEIEVLHKMGYRVSAARWI